MIKRAEERNDSWRHSVQGRLENCNDLVAEEAIYQTNCMAKFMKDDGPSHKVGRQVDTHKMENFEKLCDWFETYGDCELYTLSEVWEIMKSMSNSEVSEPKVLKRKLKGHVYFTELHYL